MPTQYKRKGTVNRARWSEENLRQALTRIRSGEISFRQAQMYYNVPTRTLQRRLESGNMSKGSLGPSGVLGSNNEKKIVEYINKLSNCGFVPNRAMVRAIAYRFAEELGLPHKFNKNVETAGDAWLSSFLRRNPELKIRRLGQHSENPQEIKKQSLAILSTAMQENDLFDKPSTIFNMDECVLEVNYTVDAAITDTQCKNTVPAVTPIERITVLTCCNAVGKFLPPVLILKEDGEKWELGDGLPPASQIYMNSKSVCVTSELFNKWFIDHFLKNKPQGKVILILDWYSSYFSSPTLYNKAIENDVIIIGCDKKPLRNSFFAPFRESFQNEVQAFAMQNPQKYITRGEIGHFLGAAWSKIATTCIGVKGFESTGIHNLKQISTIAKRIPVNPTEVSNNSNMINLTSASRTPLQFVVLRIANNSVTSSVTSTRVPSEKTEKGFAKSELTNIAIDTKSTEDNKVHIEREIQHGSRFQDKISNENLNICGSENNVMFKNDFNERMELAEPTEESNNYVNSTLQPVENVEPRTFFKEEEEDDIFLEYRDSDVSGSNSRQNESNLPNSRPFQLGQDEYDAIGYNVASKLRHMDKDQRIIAERIIAETLFQGQIGMLTIGTTCSSLCPTVPSHKDVGAEIKFNPDSSV